MGLEAEIRRKEAEKIQQRVTTPVAVSPTCDASFVGACMQIIGLNQADGKDAEALKPEVMAAVLECSQEATVASGYITKSLRVTSTYSYCSILKDNMVERARRSVQNAQWPSRFKHPEEEKLRQELLAMGPDLLAQIVIDIVIEKEGSAIAYLKHLSERLGFTQSRDIRMLISAIENVSQKQSQKQSRGMRPF